MFASHSIFRWILATAFILESTYCQTPIQRLKNCGKNDKCQGRKQQLMRSPNSMTTKEVRSLQCFCDEMCKEYGDCCWDTATYPATSLRMNIACVPLSFNESVYAVTECESSNEKYLNLCKKNVEDLDYHYVLDIPVYSYSSNTYYANIYCAYMCEGEKNYVEPINLKIKCSTENTTYEEIINGKYKPRMLTWETESGICLLVTEPNKSLGRPCVDSVYKCASNTDPMTELCAAYSQIVMIGDQRFKNPHCALCNGFNTTWNLECWQGFDYRSLPSLTMLLDFNWNFETCDFPRSVWDGLQRQCTVICTQEKCESCEETSCKKHNSDLTLVVEGYLTVISLSVSICCLFFHLFLSFFLPNANTLPSKILNSLSLSLVIAQMLFLCGIDPLIEVPDDICQTVAILIHFFFLSSFFWMNVMSIDIWRTFSNESLKSRQSRSHRRYAAYAWGVTGFVTIVSLVCDMTQWIPIDYRPHYAGVKNICWFANRNGLAIFFYLPICILLLLNTIMFGITICWFQQQHKKSQFKKVSGRKEYIRLWLYIKLFVIMGLTWGCGMLSALAEKPNFRYPFIVLNGLQGTFLFIMFDLKSGVLVHVLKKIGIKQYNNTNIEQKNSQGTQSSKLNSSSSSRQNDI